MTTQQQSELNALRAQLDAIYSEMPQTYFEMGQRDKSAFLISREIEKIENPESYERNKSHWEDHEIRL